MWKFQHFLYFEPFPKFNSGTYNNQWMVVDNKLFHPYAEQQRPGLFWVLEQIPGYIRREDLTEVLQARTFWPSYNSPYFSGQTTATSLLIHYTRLLSRRVQQERKL